jgi:para-nitrobenzyl esterase
MVWFHGGGYTHGGANESRLNGTYNVAQSGNRIVVVINYRLNVFGFLSADPLRSRSPNNSSGNYGLLDQRMALQWVQGAIVAFGGDPHSVMIFGESAGAGSVSNHLAMPNSWPFFHRAALESGSF